MNFFLQIYTLFLTSSAGCLGAEDVAATPQDWLTALQSGIDVVSRYGGASVGDRTMVREEKEIPQSLSAKCFPFARTGYM